MPRDKDPLNQTSLVVRSELMQEIAQQIKQRSWTQAEAAKFFSVTQPRISDLVTGRIDRFTVDLLMDWLTKLGKDVSVTVRDNVFSSSEVVRLTLFTVGFENERVLKEIARLFGDDPSKYDLTVVNVLESPELAKNERITATPCLIKTSPGPRVVLVGDLSPTSIRWQLAAADLNRAENRSAAADLREATLNERERKLQREENRAEREDHRAEREDHRKRDR